MEQWIQILKKKIDEYSLVVAPNLFDKEIVSNNDASRSANERTKVHFLIIFTKLIRRKSKKIMIMLKLKFCSK